MQGSQLSLESLQWLLQQLELVHISACHRRLGRCVFEFAARPCMPTCCCVCSWLGQVSRSPVLGQRHCGGMSCMRPPYVHSLTALRYTHSPANTSFPCLTAGRSALIFRTPEKRWPSRQAAQLFAFVAAGASSEAELHLTTDVGTCSASAVYLLKGAGALGDASTLQARGVDIKL